MSAYVYLLADYEEHGIEDAVATLDRGALVGLLETQWRDGQDGLRQDLSGFRGEAKATLLALLERSDEDLSHQQSFNLTRGWGGAQLYVVKLAG